MDNSEARKRKEETVQLSVTEALDMLEATLQSALELTKAVIVSLEQK